MQLNLLLLFVKAIFPLYVNLNPSKEFSTIASNINGIYSNNLGSNGYITNDGVLYVTDMFNLGYKQVLTNVDKAINERVITKDKTVYYLDTYNNTEKIIPVLRANNITDIYDVGSYFIYKNTNNEFYYDYSLPRNNSTTIKLEYNDINIPYYYDNNKFIYLNTNNKLTLNSETNNLELDLSIKSMKQILDFVK